ncbi:CDP-alcohol phosphatidyltransferase family protein [Mangrovihabitans endophyticus]|uniref:Membrane protein n=1 Tax=Mangrovihabitans endophyticus TaxID=1751298 RepID=A0A8J3C228_9ACTN|nr:CDP-alcohol phosphatidyltransferase family protein [Mangrovihabitans endophyticus]GGL07772.1 membrane protein [Mangrovihabitans endophyticus]
MGLAVHMLLLAGLSATVGLSAGGWLAGVAYGVVLTVLLAEGLRRAGLRRLGPANLVTLSRSVGVGAVTALVVTGFRAEIPVPLLVGVVGVALALDGVDGQVARRTGSSSALGARFDMEVDAFLILVLSVHLAGMFGWWTVAIGAFRYVFVAASWPMPWLTATLPPRFSRKVVAATQGVVLVVATAEVLPRALAGVAVAGALAALVWSFGRDVIWLHRQRQAAATAAPQAVASSPARSGRSAGVPVPVA